MPFHRLAHVAPLQKQLVPRGAGHFHYTGCGCEQRPWQGDEVDWIFLRDAPQPPRRRPLRIAYLIPHHNVTGGMKMIMEQLRFLRTNGHYIKAVFRGPPGSPVLPPWSDVRVDAEQLLGVSDPFLPAFADMDVGMVGYFTQLAELRGVQACPGPVFYWEQGHEQLFGDHSAAADWDATFHAAMHLPVAVGAVSEVVRAVLARHFARVAPVLPNAIDAARFHPPAGWAVAVDAALARAGTLPPSAAASTAAAVPGAPLSSSSAAATAAAAAATTTTSSRANGAAGAPEADPEATEAEAAEAAAVEAAAAATEAAESPSVDVQRLVDPARTGVHVLLVGNPALPFKNHSTALRALNHAHARVPGMRVTWMCQVPPGVHGASFPLSLVVNPSQDDVPRVYRSGFDCMLFTSVYEAWGRPPMEAMASGVPVVTSRCHGVDMFCSPRNCLSADPDDATALGDAVASCLLDRAPALARARQALRDVRAFTWARSMRALEAALYRTAYHLSPRHLDDTNYPFATADALRQRHATSLRRSGAVVLAESAQPPAVPPSGGAAHPHPHPQSRPPPTSRLRVSSTGGLRAAAARAADARLAGAHHAGAHHPGAHHTGAHHAGAHHPGAHHTGGYAGGAHHTGAHHTGAHHTGAHHTGGYAGGGSTAARHAPEAYQPTLPPPADPYGRSWSTQPSGAGGQAHAASYTHAHAAAQHQLHAQHQLQAQHQLDAHHQLQAHQHQLLGMPPPATYPPPGPAMPQHPPHAQPAGHALAPGQHGHGHGHGTGYSHGHEPSHALGYAPGRGYAPGQDHTHGHAHGYAPAHGHAPSNGHEYAHGQSYALSHGHTHGQSYAPSYAHAPDYAHGQSHVRGHGHAPVPPPGAVGYHHQPAWRHAPPAAGVSGGGLPGGGAHPAERAPGDGQSDFRLAATELSPPVAPRPAGRTGCGDDRALSRAREAHGLSGGRGMGGGSGGGGGSSATPAQGSSACPGQLPTTDAGSSAFRRVLGAGRALAAAAVGGLASKGDWRDAGGGRGRSRRGGEHGSAADARHVSSDTRRAAREPRAANGWNRASAAPARHWAAPDDAPGALVLGLELSPQARAAVAAAVRGAVAEGMRRSGAAAGDGAAVSALMRVAEEAAVAAVQTLRARRRDAALVAGMQSLQVEGWSAVVDDESDGGGSSGATDDSGEEAGRKVGGHVPLTAGEHDEAMAAASGAAAAVGRAIAIGFS